PRREAELESVLDQSAGNDIPALQDQLRLRSDHRGAGVHHLDRHRASEMRAPLGAQHFEKLRVRQRIRRGEVHGTRDLAMRDDPTNGAEKVIDVNPRQELASVAEAAESEADVAEKR